jgi:hypothetical protein
MSLAWHTAFPSDGGVVDVSGAAVDVLVAVVDGISDAAAVEVLGAVVVGLPSGGHKSCLRVASAGGGTMPECASRLGKEKLLKGI